MNRTWQLALRKPKLIDNRIDEGEKLPSKPRTPRAVDKEVDGGVNDEKEV
jgi:hypothetical protein